jgi:hypothetical protein
MAVTLTRASGQEVRYNDVPPDVYRGFGFPGAEDLGIMFQSYHDFGKYFCGALLPLPLTTVKMRLHRARRALPHNVAA